MITKMKNSLRGFFKYSSLLKELVTRDIKVRYRRSVLGIFWTVLNPLLMMIVMNIVFSTLFSNSIDNFAVYYFSGYILYTFFNESTTQALHSIVNNSALIKKVYIPKYLFPISKVASSLVNLGFSFVAMLIVMVFTGAKFHWTIILTPIPVAYLVVFCCGLGMILATMHVHFRDIGHLYGIVTLIWMYLTPLFYPAELLITNGMGILLEFNPLYHYIVYFRMLIMDGQVPGLYDNLLCIGLSSIMLILGVVVFYKKQDKFILYV